MRPVNSVCVQKFAWKARHRACSQGVEFRSAMFLYRVERQSWNAELYWQVSLSPHTEVSEINSLLPQPVERPKLESKFVVLFFFHCTLFALATSTTTRSMQADVKNNITEWQRKESRVVLEFSPSTLVKAQVDGRPAKKVNIWYSCRRQTTHSRRLCESCRPRDLALLDLVRRALVMNNSDRTGSDCGLSASSYVAIGWVAAAVACPVTCTRLQRRSRAAACYLDDWTPIQRLLNDVTVKRPPSPTVYRPADIKCRNHWVSMSPFVFVQPSIGRWKPIAVHDHFDPVFAEWKLISAWSEVVAHSSPSSTKVVVCKDRTIHTFGFSSNF